MKRNWTQNEVAEYDAAMRERFTECDIFFPGSAAAELKISLQTFRNYQSENGSLGFIKCLENGAIATCSTSLRAFHELRVAEREEKVAPYPFIGGFRCSSNSTTNAGEPPAAAPVMNDDNRKPFVVWMK